MMGGCGLVVLCKKISITQRERYVWTLSVPLGGIVCIARARTGRVDA